jgi:hypothetical protein
MAKRSAANGIDTASVAVELSRLRELDAPALRRRWHELYGTEPPKRISRDLITRAVAHRLQELSQGGLNPALRRRLRQLADEVRATGGLSIAREPRLKPGTRLIREWQGAVCEVTVLDDGFTWQGQRWRSLSQIARAITGTRWSGPLFFGLKPPRRAVRSIGDAS